MSEYVSCVNKDAIRNKGHCYERSKDATNVALGLNKKLLGSPGLTSSNKKLLVTRKLTGFARLVCQIQFSCGLPRPRGRLEGAPRSGW